MRILMMLASEPGDRPNRNLGLDQVVEPFYLLQDAGAEVVVVSVQGGDPLLRSARKPSARAIAVLERFRDDRRARDVISDTLRFAQIYPEDFDAGICIGALEGTVEATAAAACTLVVALLDAGKTVAVVPSDLCHWPQKPLEGLLIVGDQTYSPHIAAKALLATLEAD